MKVGKIYRRVRKETKHPKETLPVVDKVYVRHLVMYPAPPKDQWLHGQGFIPQGNSSLEGSS